MNLHLVLYIKLYLKMLSFIYAVHVFKYKVHVFLYTVHVFKFMKAYSIVHAYKYKFTHLFMHSTYINWWMHANLHVFKLRQYVCIVLHFSHIYLYCSLIYQLFKIVSFSYTVYVYKFKNWRMYANLCVLKLRQYLYIFINIQYAIFI